MSKCFIVIGPPRTGTSLVMGLLVKLGVYGGNDYRTGTGNPCYYEDRELHQYVSDRKDVPLEGDVTAKSIVERLSVESPWGMKHPRLVKCWEDFKPLIPHPHFIVTHRNVNSQYQSHVRQIRTQSRDAFLNRTGDHYRKLDLIIARHEFIDVNYEEFMNGDRELKRLAQFAGLPITDEAKTFANPTLKHF